MDGRRARKGGAWAVLLLLVLLTAASTPTAAATGQEASVGPGEVYLPEALVVERDATLRLRPGTLLHGPGHLEVYGNLHADGTRDAPVVFHVPVILAGNGTTHLRNVTVEGIVGAALTVSHGHLTIENGTFRDNRLGLVATDPPATLRLRDTAFDSHATALRIEGVAQARLDNVTLRDNAVGLLARLDGAAPLNLTLAGCRFEDNLEHVRLDFGATPNPGADVRVARGTFRAGAFVVSSDLSSEPASLRPPVVRLERNHFAGSDVGLTARGAGFLVESVDDTFESNRIALSAAQSSVALQGTRFWSLERDLDLDEASRVTLDGAVMTAVTAAGGAPAPSPALAPTWAFVVGALVAGGGVATVWSGRRAAGAVPQADRMEAPADDAQEAGAGDATASAPMLAALAALAAREWSTLEARILHDISEHPGTPQTEVARRLGLSRQALHYHVKKLVDAGAIVKTPQGRTTECRIAPGVRLPPLPPAVTQQEGLEKG